MKKVKEGNCKSLKFLANTLCDKEQHLFNVFFNQMHYFELREHIYFINIYIYFFSLYCFITDLRKSPSGSMNMIYDTSPKNRNESLRDL